MRDEVDKITADNVDTEEISILLIGNDEEQKLALELIHQYLKKLLIWKIRNSALGLTSEEVIEVYQELLITIWKSAQKKQYDPDKPLLPFLFTLAQRRAIDRIRKNTRNQKNEDELLDDVFKNLKNTKVGEAWQIVASSENGSKMMEIFRQTAVKMPLHQRQVASVMIDHFPDEIPLPELREEIYKRTGEQLTIIAVKSARREVRTKIRQQLIKAGYMEDNSNESTN